MAKTIHEFSSPSIANVATGRAMIDANSNFEFKPALTTMVQPSPFCGKAHEDANAHLHHFLEICGTFTIKGIPQEAILLCLFPFTLLGKAKQWFYANHDSVDIWDKCSNAFLVKFFVMGKTNALCNKISSFTQQAEESILDAWERMQEYVAARPHHGMEDWLLIQNIYHGLVPQDRSHLDAAAGAAFFSLGVADAKALIEKMVSNQGWNDEQLLPRKRGMHSLKEADMIVARDGCIGQGAGTIRKDEYPKSCSIPGFTHDL